VEQLILCGLAIAVLAACTIPLIPYQYRPFKLIFWLWTGLNVLGYILAREYIHTLTGVDAHNFLRTLALFTGITAGLLLALGYVGFASINGLISIFRRYRVGWEIACFVGIVFCVLGLWHRSCVSVGESLATYVLVKNEFSHDPTCQRSNEFYWAAPLKDREELEASNVLFAEYNAWNDIYFWLGQCAETSELTLSGNRWFRFRPQ
jgi:hypothetical protein